MKSNVFRACTYLGLFHVFMLSCIAVYDLWSSGISKHHILEDLSSNGSHRALRVHFNGYRKSFQQVLYCSHTYFKVQIRLYYGYIRGAIQNFQDRFPINNDFSLSHTKLIPNDSGHVLSKNTKYLYCINYHNTGHMVSVTCGSLHPLLICLK